MQPTGVPRARRGKGTVATRAAATPNRPGPAPSEPPAAELPTPRPPAPKQPPSKPPAGKPATNKPAEPPRDAAPAAPDAEPPPEPVARLSRELARAAAELEASLARCAELHGQFMRQAETQRDWGHIEETLSDELRHRRLKVMQMTVEAMPELLRTEAAEAAARFPDVDVTGARLPLVPSGEDPEIVADWWHDLRNQDRAIVVERLSQWCGRTDGIPAEVRHRTNMALLAEEIHARAAGIQDEMAAAAAPDSGPLPSGAMTESVEDRERRDLRGLLKLRALFTPPDADLGVPRSVVPAESLAALDEITTPLKQRGLYLLDARDYPLRTAVLLGDLSLAHTVILHVPGTTTTVDLRLYREATWMSALREEAGRIAGPALGGTDGVAVLDWIGYQAPYDVAARRALGESGIRWIVPGEAVDDRYAREAAPLLVRAARGLRALVGPHVRLVASGHSYGASVLGLAMQETDVFDAAIITGCPGLFTDTVDKLLLPPGKLYAAVATGDIVTRLQIFGPDVAKMAGVKLLGAVPHLASYPDGGRAWTRLNMGHESYYDRGSSLLNDLAAAAVGEDPPSRWPAWAT
ncbi:MAG: alpha/beta hydrolase family protein [Austwickia sp.]|nr:alpha/beta hydrolase family protein [Austwickia sp.]